MQVTRLDRVQGLRNVKTAIIVLEALREQALHWSILLQDEDPAAAASWELLQPLLIARLDIAVNKTHKYRLISALQQRQHENAKDFLNRCKTAWYELLRRNRATYRTDPEKAAHDSTRKECIKCMFVSGISNKVRLAVEQIAGNTETLKTAALAAAVQYKSAINVGVVKPGQALRYGVSAIEVTGGIISIFVSTASFSRTCRNFGDEARASSLTSALVALKVRKKGWKQKLPGGQARGPREAAPAGAAGRAGAGRSTSEALGPVYLRVYWQRLHLLIIIKTNRSA
jgi:hypothetical protein